MANQFEIPRNIPSHICDLHDILGNIHEEQVTDVESVWYEYWDKVLNDWTRRSSNSTTRMSVSPQRQLTREVLLDDPDSDEGAYSV